MIQPIQTFDPGGSSVPEGTMSCDPVTSICCVTCTNGQKFCWKSIDPDAIWVGQTQEVYHMLSRASKLTPAHYPGHIVLEGTDEILLDTVLFDSGLLGANIISPRVIEANPMLKSRLEPATSRLCLGDAKTIYPITHQIRLPVRFADPNGIVHTAMLKFLIFETGNDMIIGLPTILRELFACFFSILEKGRKKEGVQDDIELNFIENFEAVNYLHALEMLKFGCANEDEYLFNVELLNNPKVDEAPATSPDMENVLREVKVIFHRNEGDLDDFLTLQPEVDAKHYDSKERYQLPTVIAGATESIKNAAIRAINNQTPYKIHDRDHIVQIKDSEVRYNDEGIKIVTFFVYMKRSLCARVRNLTDACPDAIARTAQWVKKEHLPIIRKANKVFIEDSEWIDHVLNLYSDENYYDSAFMNMLAAMSPMEAGELTSTPWSDPYDDQPAPEDEECPLAVNFEFALNHMSKDNATAVREFREKLVQQVDKEFADDTDILKLLDEYMDVFVPQNWDGIKVPPLELRFKQGMPDYYKPPNRRINPKVLETAYTEFQRLKTYFYEEHSGPIAHPTVCAPKATPPYVRFAGSYDLFINNWIEPDHFPIPNVQEELQKIKGFKYFCDIDMKNAFHQFKLSQHTSELLSIQNMFGQFRPKFMPEGIGPASGYLQKQVRQIFAGFEEFTITIFDNILVLGKSKEDMMRRIKQVLDRCREFNVILKIEKSWFGHVEAHFFGYHVTNEGFELTDERKSAVTSIPFPTNKKKAMSFLGCAVFFKDFIPDFSDKMARLHDMTHNDFSFDEKTWKVDYKQEFENFKEALLKATMIYYPDYTLKWIVRADASKLAVGCVLLQELVKEDGTLVLQPIAFASQKLSPQAQRWAVIEQECYSLYFAVKKFSYYLMCKEFILETDHNNLVWIEASEVAKIIRWRIFMKGFVFKLRHIPGRLNIVADWLSRMYGVTVEQVFNYLDDMVVENKLDPDSIAATCETLFHFFDIPAHSNVNVDVYSSDVYSLNLDREVVDAEVDAKETAPKLNEEMISQVEAFNRAHRGKQKGHVGIRATYNNLNDMFPGHGISIRTLIDWISQCGICQKYRIGHQDTLKPIIRVIKPEGARILIGCDMLTLTPADSNGNKYLYVIYDLFTKFIQLYPSQHKSAEVFAEFYFKYMSTFGRGDILRTDPGSEFMSDIVKLLNEWFGVNHEVSLVDRHESNGVERVNQEIIHLVRCIVQDERLVDKWSTPQVLCWTEWILNNRFHSEGGIVPAHAVFGRIDEQRRRLPEVLPVDKDYHEYIKNLNECLIIVRDIAAKHQAEIAVKRLEANVGPHNEFQEGDLVFIYEDEDFYKDGKLNGKFTGPYQVASHYRNKVSCEHLVTNKRRRIQVDRLKPFFGSVTEAYQLALRDNNEFVVDSILGHSGEACARKAMDFEVKYRDGDKKWHQFEDIRNTIYFEAYCQNKSYLLQLLMTVKQYSKQVSTYNKQPIDMSYKGRTIYLDLRYWGWAWYKKLGLPDFMYISYVVQAKYTKISSNRQYITVTIPIYKMDICVRHNWIYEWGVDFAIPQDAILVDHEFVKKYPLALVTDLSKTLNYLTAYERNRAPVDIQSLLVPPPRKVTKILKRTSR